MKSQSQKATLAYLLAGGAVASSFIAAESANAQFIGADSQSRASGAITNVLSNTNTTNFAAEVVFPEKDFAPSGALTMNVTYSSVNGDPSQVVISNANFSASNATYSASTVEAATARAIDSAEGLTRFGDIIGIVKQWQSGGSAALD